MTGEMGFIDQNGIDSNGDEWPLHAAIAKALKGEVKPFDVYQGPYVVFGKDIRLGNSPYAVAPVGMGIKRLWLVGDDALLKWYREDNEKESQEFWWDDTEEAIEAAKMLL